MYKMLKFTMLKIQINLFLKGEKTCFILRGCHILHNDVMEFCDAVLETSSQHGMIQNKSRDET